MHQSLTLGTCTRNNRVTTFCNRAARRHAGHFPSMNIEHHSSNSHNVLKIAEKYNNHKKCPRTCGTAQQFEYIFKTSLIISLYSILGKFKPLDLKHGMWILHIQHSAEAIKLVPLLAWAEYGIFQWHLHMLPFLAQIGYLVNFWVQAKNCTFYVIVA